MKHKTLFLPVAIAAALALGACGDRADDASVAGPGANPPAMPAPADTPYNDADSGIDPGPVGPVTGEATAGDLGVDDERAALGVLNAINDHEIAAGRLALEKGVSGAVAAYAQQMIDAHGENRQLTAALNPDGSADAARTQSNKGAATRQRLSGLDGDAFARAYVQAMVDDHAQALLLFDEELIPSAESADIREHLEVTREHVAHHLAQARELSLP